MAAGTGLMKFREEHKNRFFDVGIAEQHAVTFCAGLAKGGYLPVFAVYSSFLQRSYDQIIHDAALQGLKVVLAVDRAGIVGEDGETHQGMFDTAFLTSIPNVTVYAACDYGSLRLMLDAALYGTPGVVAVRYPRGAAPAMPPGYAFGSLDYTRFGAGAKTALVTFGRTAAAAAAAREALKTRGKECDLVALARIHPLPKELFEVLGGYENLLIFEEGVKDGGVGEHIAAALALSGWRGRIRLTAASSRTRPPAAFCGGTGSTRNPSRKPRRHSYKRSTGIGKDAP